MQGRDRSSFAAQVGAVTFTVGALLGVLVAAFGRPATALLLAGLLVAGLLVAGWARLSDDSRLRRAGTLVAAVVCAAAVGLVLAVVGAAAGPLAMVLLPVALTASAAVAVRPVLSVALVVLVVPVGLRDVPGQSFGVQIMQVTALVAVGAAVVGRAVQGLPPVRLPRPLLWAVALVPWAFLSTLSAVAIDPAVRQLVALAVNVGLALVAATVVTTTTVLRRVLWLVLAVGAVVGGVGLLNGGELESAYGGGAVQGRLVGTFTQPNQFGSFAMVVACIGVGLLLALRRPAQRLTALVLLAPVVAGLLLSLSRSSWIGLLGGLAVLLVLLPTARRALLVAAVPLVLGAVALGAFAPESPQVQVVGARVSTLAESGGGNPYDRRPRIWAEARRQVAADPWTGQGPGSFPVVSTTSASGAATVRAEHAHDVLLTAAAELGLPGAALLVGLGVHIALVVGAAARSAPTAERAMLAGLAAACAAVAVQGVVDYTMRNAVLFAFFWLLAGLTVAAAAVSRRAGEGSAQAAAAAARAAVSAAVRVVPAPVSGPVSGQASRGRTARPQPLPVPGSPPGSR